MPEMKRDKFAIRRSCGDPAGSSPDSSAQNHRSSFPLALQLVDPDTAGWSPNSFAQNYRSSVPPARGLQASGLFTRPAAVFLILICGGLLSAQVAPTTGRVGVGITQKNLTLSEAIEMALQNLSLIHI